MISFCSVVGRVTLMIDKIESPHDFYKHVVVVDILEFNNKADDLRLAYHVCISLLSLRDWVEVTYKGKAWQWNGTPRTPWSGRNDLQSQLQSIHYEFGIITDVANASKHLKLDKSRSRTKAEGIANVHVQSISTTLGGALLGAMGFNTTMFSEAPEVVTEDSVVINDGGKLYDVRTSVESINLIWLKLFSENNW
jgi:hypothetical protein